MVKKRPAVKKSVKSTSKTKAKKTKKLKPKTIKAKKRPVAKKISKPKKPVKAKKLKPKKTKLPAKVKKLKPSKKITSKNTKSKSSKEKTKMLTHASSKATTKSKSNQKSSKHYMSSKNLDIFKNALLKWKQDLMAGVDKTIHHMQDEAANFADPNDRATQEEEFSLELRTRDRERKLMTKIDEALERIENGDYGHCEECGIEIGLERLRARPTATLCIDCKTLDEIREKQLAN